MKEPLHFNKEPLHFNKITLDKMDNCYAVLGLLTENGPVLLFGAEGEGLLISYSGPGFSVREAVWEGGGGTMSIVPVPGRDGWALASRGFYTMADCKDSRIEIIRKAGGSYTHTPVARVNYLHRFDTLLAPDGTLYLLAASLHSGKKDPDDWSTPGHLYAGILPEKLFEDLQTSSQILSENFQSSLQTLSEDCEISIQRLSGQYKRPPQTFSEGYEIPLQTLPGEYYMNHGFFKGTWKSREAAFIASREGVFAVLPPEKAGGSWEIEQLLPIPVSDIALCDLDGDGLDEMACLLPFHGNRFCIFKQQDNTWKQVYEHPAGNDFYHAVSCGILQDEKVFAAGARSGRRELFLVRWDKETGSYFSQTIDTGSGPSNVAFLNTKEGGLLLSAERMIQEAAVYIFGE